MPLIYCPNSDCDRQVSSNTPACPSCGVHIKENPDIEIISSDNDLNNLLEKIGSPGTTVGSKIMIVGELSQEISKSYNQIKKKHATEKAAVGSLAGALLTALLLSSCGKNDELSKLISQNKDLLENIGKGGLLAGVVTVSQIGDLREQTKSLPLVDKVEFLYLSGFRLSQNRNNIVILLRHDLSTEQAIGKFVGKQFNRLIGN
jgi:hypothetical protein